jgi:hypothetical protein
VIALGVPQRGVAVFANYGRRLLVVRLSGKMMQLQDTPIIVAANAASRVFGSQATLRLAFTSIAVGEHGMPPLLISHGTTIL